ncbi:PAS domain-containing sensor histidine kinase [Alkalilimnicola ehrlichii]|uniref:Phosphate regulon sensor protein PhoR n=1 Tax=Alkalilimnicola ehrlichii TaxID=351052 RepID=A0A3E0WYR4_9GAMM|nr:phosphate regulon sensor histidine kinase PhoR [Alkalilimnicola ehrlichii]RFA30375.1 PAS domain-containing sensor histidine kinase [Alkalilimnicola ehrlichii]RFA37948.1 PAS domain-containing sensor histidine kinase [Alkalilimnicola ehrlichii]
MIPYNPWPGVLLRWGLLTAGLGVLGYLVNQLFLVLFLGTLIYLGWHLSNVARLEFWLRTDRRFEPPHGRGLWEDIFNHIYRLQKHHRQRRRRLIEMLQAFRESIDAMPDAAVVLRDDGEMQWWNSAAEHLLGLKWPKDAGLRLENLFRNPEFSEFIQRTYDKPEPIRLPSPVNESIVLDIRLVPYGRNQRLLLGRDVTRLQRLESMRRDFVANVSHELRTPLTVIQGVSETLVEADLEAADRHGLELIQQQAQRMGRLVEDLLQLSRLETSSRPADVAPVDVPAMLHSLRREAETLSGDREHFLQLDVRTQCQVLADEGELRSAFSNLVFNAVNYTPPGGAITLKWWCDKDGAHFSVTDTGIGIPAKHIPRLTERFYRVDRGRSTKTGGTGLGLAIVKHILQRYDARLAIESKPGVGSTFSCHFPIPMCYQDAAASRAG